MIDRSRQLRWRERWVIGVPGTLEPSLVALSGAIPGPGCPSTPITHRSRAHGRHPTRLRLVPGTRSTYSMRWTRAKRAFSLSDHCRWRH